MSAGRDFADWLSPMLVKELRQGMRSRLFVISFLLLQGAMIFVALLGLAASSNQSDIAAVTGFFWTIIVVPLLLIMPMSGLNAVGGERKANTLELIFLTRLTARRIISGKWFAIVAQTILLVCAVLPYAMLRYFLGGVDLGGEIGTIVVLLFCSALMSGAAVGLSPQSTRLTRVLLGLGIFFGFQILVPLFAFVFRFAGPSGMGGPKMDWRIYVGFALLGLILLLLMLEFGAAKIAPPAENHSTPRRLLVLVALIVVGGFAFMHLNIGPLVLATVVLVTPVCVGALCEPVTTIPSIYRPFVRFGLLGKLAGRLLYPGWPSGVFFCLALLLVLVPIGFKQARTSDQIWIWWAIVAIAGALFFPIALVRTFFPRARRPGVIFVLIEFGCALLTAMAAMFESFKLIDFRSLLALIPPCGLLLSNSGALDSANISWVLLGTGAVTAGSILILLVKMTGLWRQIGQLEKAATTLPATGVVHVTSPQPAT